MQLIERPDQYDGWQAYFSYEILRTIRDELVRATLPPERIRELTATIGFAVTCLLDSSTTFVVEGEAVTPVLTFSNDGEVLVHQGGPSNLHDYAFGNADLLFDQ